MDLNEHPVITLVIDSIIDKLYYQSALDNVSDGGPEPTVLHINLSKEVVEAIEGKAHGEIPTGVSQEAVDKFIDERTEELLEELLVTSLNGVNPKEVKVVIYMQPTAEDHLANARIEWLLAQLPADCDIRVVHMGENKKYWVEHRGINNPLLAARRLILT